MKKFEPKKSPNDDEREQNVIGVYRLSTSSFFVPPVLIYPTKRMHGSLS
jgi:hypothetical protein